LQHPEGYAVNMTVSSNKAVLAFQSRYKFKIAGQTDLLFSNVGGLIKDSNLFSVFKSRRISQAGQISALNATEPDATLRTKKTSEATVTFLESSYRIIKKADADPAISAKRIVNAASFVARDFSTSVENYAAARGQMESAGTYGDASADDTAFLESATRMLADLKSLASRQKVFLQQEKVFFSVQLNQINKYIARAEAAMATISSGSYAMAPPPAEAAMVEDDPSVVPPSETAGSALDIEV
jgi:hypothetical protein